MSGVILDEPGLCAIQVDGDGNRQSLMVTNPGSGWVQEDVVNLGIGP